jgi:hypothetical protein
MQRLAGELSGETIVFTLTETLRSALVENVVYLENGTSECKITFRDPKHDRSETFEISGLEEVVFINGQGVALLLPWEKVEVEVCVQSKHASSLCLNVLMDLACNLPQVLKHVIHTDDLDNRDFEIEMDIPQQMIAETSDHQFVKCDLLWGKATCIAVQFPENAICFWMKYSTRGHSVYRRLDLNKPQQLQKLLLLQGNTFHNCMVSVTTPSPSLIRTHIARLLGVAYEEVSVNRKRFIL